VIVAVGNKDDDSNRKVVSSHDAQNFATQSGITLFETSAKENVNIEEVFHLTLHLNSEKVCWMNFANSKNVILETFFCICI